MATKPAAVRDRDGDMPEEGLSGWSDLLRPVSLVALAWSLFQLAIWWWPDINLAVQRSAHAGFGAAVALLATGERSASPAARLLNRALAASAMIPAVYLAFQTERITYRISTLDPVLAGDYACAILLIVLLAEAGRRVLGWGMVALALGFAAYQLLGPYLPAPLGHNQRGLELFVDQQFLTLDGLLGIPIGVSVDTVYYFILFAAVFEVFGGGKMMVDLALALTGRRIGGPAKAAVAGSALMGTISGSAVANVMGTGIFTIPLMKRAGYPPKFAASVEAVASTGSQLMPPVMGAGAFIMADLLRVPFSTVVIAAALPAVFYYAALMFAVDFKARLDNLGTVSPGDVPRVRLVLGERGLLLLPLAWLTVLVTSGYGVADACAQAIGLTILAGVLRKPTRAGVFPLVRALVLAARRTVSVALPCALAGLVVGVIAFTGLGTKFTAFVVDVSAGSTAVLMVLTMLATLVLGCGMPTTSAYIMASVLTAPALVAVGVAPILAHMFIFYYAVLSMITPPVALAAYAAAGIAGTSPAATGWTAVALGVPGMLIPFVFFWHPGLVLVGTPAEIALSVVLTLTAVVGLSVAIVGWLFRPIGPAGRTAFALLAIGGIAPGSAIALASALAIGAGGAVLWLSERQAQRAAAR